MSLSVFWETFRTTRAFQSAWPDGQSVVALEAIRGFNKADAERLESDFEFVSKYGTLPIIAVAGLLNAGKSSLAACRT